MLNRTVGLTIEVKFGNTWYIHTGDIHFKQLQFYIGDPLHISTPFAPEEREQKDKEIRILDKINVDQLVSSSWLL